jgi:hypothetical protein
MSDQEPKPRPAYERIREMMAGIPRELWPLLLPRSAAELPALEEGIAKLRAREEERSRVMAIQKLCGLPLRPNATLRATKARARLQGIMRERMLERYNRMRNGE